MVSATNRPSNRWRGCDHSATRPNRYSVRFVATEGTGAGDGTPSTPYPDLAGALTDAPDEVTLIFQAGSTHLLSGTMAVLDKPQVYKGSNVLLIHE